MIEIVDFSYCFLFHLFFQFHFSFVIFRVFLFIQSDIFPIKENSSLSTREFLQRVIDICLEFIDESNDRSRPILRYNDPDEMKTKFNFNIGKEPINLEQIVHDCAQALYYQVRTGKFLIFFSLLFCFLLFDFSVI